MPFISQSTYMITVSCSQTDLPSGNYLFPFCHLPILPLVRLSDSSVRTASVQLLVRIIGVRDFFIFKDCFQLDLLD